MDKDIAFALAVLKQEYDKRRKYLLETELGPDRMENALTDVECLSASILKIEFKFNE